jgi:FkbM family methyltransferase
MINALKFYSEKYNYKNDDLMIIDIGANIGWYTTFLGKLKYNILSFEPLPENYHVLTKNFCRNNKNFFIKGESITLINKGLYPINTTCNYYKDIKKVKKDIVLCDKKKEKNLDRDYVQIGLINTIKLANFIPSILKKKITLLILDLDIEGEMAIESGKELIYEYHIPYIFIEFNKSIFHIHETDPQNFLRFFSKNGYKISLNGFLTNMFITIEDLIKIDFISINLYLIYYGK